MLRYAICTRLLLYEISPSRTNGDLRASSAVVKDAEKFDLTHHQASAMPFWEGWAGFWVGWLQDGNGQWHDITICTLSCWKLLMLVSLVAPIASHKETLRYQYTTYPQYHLYNPGRMVAFPWNVALDTWLLVKTGDLIGLVEKLCSFPTSVPQYHH